MDREIEPDILRRRTLRRRILAGAALGAVALVLIWGPTWFRPAVAKSRVRIATVDAGPLDATITASGVVVPEVEQVLSSPVDARVVRILERPGSALKKGDAILELDLTPQRLVVQRLEREVALKENAQAGTKLSLGRTLLDLSARKDIKRLQLASNREALARSRELATAGLISLEALKQAELAVAQAEIELRQIEGEEQNAREATRTQVEGLGLEIATLRQERDEALRQLRLATTVTDRDGVLTWTLSEEGVAVHKGDAIARVADLRSFRVDATVSDVHARTLRAGLPVKVRVGVEILPGVVSSVHPTVQNGTMTLSVALENRSSSLLRSNLRVDVLIVTDRKAHVLRVERGPGVGGAGEQQVFVVRGGRARRTPARFGIASFDRFEVLAGLALGDEVIVSDMGEYMQAREVSLR